MNDIEYAIDDMRDEWGKRADHLEVLFPGNPITKAIRNCIADAYKIQCMVHELAEKGATK